jgi:hypothetical protein
LYEKLGLLPGIFAGLILHLALREETKRFWHFVCEIACAMLITRFARYYESKALGALQADFLRILA